MNTFRETDFVILDVETTGLSPVQGDRVIEVGALKIQDLKPVERFYSLVDPQRPLSYGAFLVNQISAEMLEGAPVANQVMPGFLEFLGDACLVGHNIGFDLSFIEHELSLIGPALPSDIRVLDTVKMARSLLPQIERYNLLNVAQSLAIEVVQTHRAMADVELTWEVFRRLLEIADRRDIVDINVLLILFGKNARVAQTQMETRLALIREAIGMVKKLRLIYAGAKSTEVTTRDVTPKRLLGSGEDATLVGFCHLRNEERHFKLNRIVYIEPDSA